MIQTYLPNVHLAEIWQGLVDTALMLVCSMSIIAPFGVALGLLLFVISEDGLFANKKLYMLLSLLVNVLRSVPFIILLIVLIPITKFVAGTSLGIKGSILPLVISATPFLSRLIESNLREVSTSSIEMGQSFGASNLQIVTKILLPEAAVGVIASITTTTVALVSFTAMSGLIGAGGLGDLAIRYGYQRMQTDVAFVAVILLIILVQVIQFIGDMLVVRFTRT